MAEMSSSDRGRGAGGSSRRGERGGRTPGAGRPKPGADEPFSDLPRGRHEPAGIERARRREGAPPRPGRRPTGPAPTRPPLPVDEEPRLPKAVRRDIERVLGRGNRSRDVALALSIGGEAIDLDEPHVAIEVLGWAKHVAPRIAAVREAYGIARYLDEDWAGALTELQAYRRMTGRVDQNHVIADCLRALGRGLDRVAGVVEELLAEDRAPEDRRAEGVVVWASALADAGDVGAGRALLRRFLDRPDTSEQPHDVRMRAVAARLAELDGDLEDARRQRARVADSEPELFEAMPESGAW